MRRRFALLAGLALSAGTAAHADDDPRELFGFGKKPDADHASCADAKTLGCATATDRFDAVSPHALRTWLPASYLLKLPVADARADAVAHYGVGASRDEAGPAFGGATGLENRWTIEGAPVDSMRTGGIETRVPLTFASGILVTAGGFAARDRTSTGGTIDVQLRRGGDHHVVEAFAWVSGTAEGRRRPIPELTFQVRRLSIAAGPDASMSVVATGPLPRFAGGKAWYAAGIAPAFAFTDFSWAAARLVDLDQDGTPDGFPNVIELETITNTSERTFDYLVPMMGRAGWERGPHALDLTLIGHANRDTFFLAQSTHQAAGIDREGWVGDAIATWRGTWKRTHARAQLAWHRSVRRENAHDPAAADVPQLLSAYVPETLVDDPRLAALCDDLAADDTYPLIPNCPVPFGFFASGGAGLLTDTVGDRPTVTADITHAKGNHTLRAGATLEDARVVLSSGFTAGEQLRSLFDGHLDRSRFYEGECTSFTVDEPETPCNYTISQELRYRTRYTAAYVEDTFEPSPGLRVDGGLRWELMWVGPRLHLSREWAPRLGVAYDPTGNGSARLWASMGRSFVYLPAGTGSTLIIRNSTVRDVETALGRFRNINSGAAFAIAPGIEPAAQDEVTAGIELGVAKLVRVVAWGQGRSLVRGYETVLKDPDAFAVEFDNPGREETPARRESMTFAAEVMIAPTPNMTVRASYLYGSTTGTWTGPFDPRQGAQLYNGSDWDSDLGNSFGRLPSDAGHRVFFELSRRGRVGSFELAAAARLTTTSGRPRSVLADGDLGVIYLLPRGDHGRSELISQANVRLAARWRHTDLTLDVFNLFNHRVATTVDEIYASGDIKPIVNGTDEDLVWAKRSNGAPVARRSAYLFPNSFQAPFALTLGIRQAF